MLMVTRVVITVFKKCFKFSDSSLFNFLAPCSASKLIVLVLDLHDWGMHGHG